jgi:hypothetical protein
VPSGHARCPANGEPFRAPRLPLSQANQQSDPFKEIDMGKYFIGWLLGVPAVVLLVLWFFFR